MVIFHVHETLQMTFLRIDIPKRSPCRIPIYDNFLDKSQFSALLRASLKTMTGNAMSPKLLVAVGYQKRISAAVTQLLSQ